MPLIRMSFVSVSVFSRPILNYITFQLTTIFGQSPHAPPSPHALGWMGVSGVLLNLVSISLFAVLSVFALLQTATCVWFSSVYDLLLVIDLV